MAETKGPDMENRDPTNYQEELANVSHLYAKMHVYKSRV